MDAAQSVLLELAALVRPSFGPAGLDVLLVDAAGRAWTTNATIDLVDVWAERVWEGKGRRDERAVGRLLVSMVKRVHASAGDGAAAFLLLLQAVVARARPPGGRTGGAMRRTRLAAAVQDVARETHLPSVLAAVKAEDAVHDVLRAAVGNRFAPSVVARLVALAAELLQAEEDEDGWLTLARETDRAVTAVGGPRVGESTALAGVLVETRVPLADMGADEAWHDVPVAIVHAELVAWDERRSGQVAGVETSRADVQLARMAATRTAVAQLAALGARVVFSFAGVSDQLVSVARQHGLVVLGPIERAESDALCRALGTRPITSLPPSTPSTAERTRPFVAHVRRIARVRLNQRADLLHVDVGPLCRSRHVLVCAPADLLARAYARSLHHMLTVAAAWRQSGFLTLGLDDGDEQSPEGRLAGVLATRAVERRLAGDVMASEALQILAHAYAALARRLGPREPGLPREAFAVRAAVFEHLLASLVQLLRLDGGPVFIRGRFPPPPSDSDSDTSDALSDASSDS